MMNMKNKANGFTLIEVLIALVIISVALTAIIKATSQNIRDTAYIQDKMIAHWVGLQAMNEARANITKSANQVSDITMLDKEWRWKQTTIDTPNPNIKKIDITVYRKNNNMLLTTLTSYLYVAQP